MAHCVLTKGIALNDNQYYIVRSPAATRPLTLSNTDSKLVSGALALPLEEPAAELSFSLILAKDASRAEA